MQNVYLDPNSYVHLKNVLFEKSDRHNTNNCREPFIFLQEFCSRNNINLQTIDYWPANVKTSDVYVSFDHKFFLRKWCWQRKNPAYQPPNAAQFSKRILFQFEPPVVMPEIRFLSKHVLNIYDKSFFTWNISNTRARYFHTPQAHGGVFSECWKNRNRKFLTLIQSNRKALFRHKELLTERVRAILFFAKSNDIDLYGFGWDTRPLFPYWFQKGAIGKVYQGAVQNKYETLSRYTFALAFENCELPGYITDKIFDCFFAGTIPIYLGPPDIEEYIPKSCFINKRDFASYEELKQYLKSLSEPEINTYRENGRRFIESEQYKPFTKEYFANVFVEACIA